MQVAVQAGWIAVAGALLGLVINAARPEGISLRAPIETATDESCVAPPAQTRIQVDQALALHRDKKAIFLDVRAADAYAGGHVAEALHLPCQSKAPAWLGRVTREKTLILYGSADVDAERVAHAVSSRGHIDARVLDGGFGAWKTAGGPSESGSCDACE